RAAGNGAADSADALPDHLARVFLGAPVHFRLRLRVRARVISIPIHDISPCLGCLFAPTPELAAPAGCPVTTGQDADQHGSVPGRTAELQWRPEVTATAGGGRAGGRSAPVCVRRIETERVGRPRGSAAREGRPPER